MRHPELKPLHPLRHPCPCGSGKRFKNCCVDEVSVDDHWLRAVESREPGFLAAIAAAFETDPLLQKG
jgi:hypothetical protein